MDDAMRRPTRLVASTRRVRRPALLALVVAVLSISVVMGAQASAMAGGVISQVIDATEAGAEAIGEDLPAGAEVVGEVAGEGALAGACAASVVCGSVALLGGIAMASSPLWMPYAKGLFSSASSSSSGGSTVASCNYSLSGTIAGANSVTVEVDIACSSDNYIITNSNSTAWSAVCSSASGAVVSGASTPPAMHQTIDTGGSQIYTYTPCPSGDTVLEATGGTSGVWGGSSGLSPETFIANGAVPTSDVSVDSTMTCNLPGGGTGTVTAGVTGVDGEMPVPSCEQAYPGSTPAELDSSCGLAGHEQPCYKATFNNPATDYPDCFDSNGNFLASTCVVRVYVNGVECTRGANLCSDWYDELDEDGYQVQCKWGPYVVEMDDCTPLKQQYKSTATTQRVTDPTTGIAAGTGTTGDTSGDTSGDGSSDTNGDGDTDTLPDSGTNPDDSAQTGSDCGGFKWSWNPVDWVEQPVKCAIDWAFEPDPSDWGLGDLEDAFTSRPPGSLVAGLASMVTAAYDSYEGAGCGRIADFGRVGSDPDVALSCATISAQGGVHDIYVCVQVALWGLTGFALFRLALGALGTRGAS